MSPAPEVSIICVPRERFSCAQEALESLLELTPEPHELIYVEGNAPEPVSSYLKKKADEVGFTLLRQTQYLSPNQARNIGLKKARGKYIVFIDNDVLVSPGWLSALLDCARDTGADIVGPLYFIGNPQRRIIHMAGGILSHEKRGKQLFLHEEHRFMDIPYPQAAAHLRREPTDFVEFHCALVDAEVFRQLGPLDEALLSTREHLDLCMSVRKAHGKIYFEPAAEVTYLARRMFHVYDLPYFNLRWCDEWNDASHAHFQQKWHVTRSSPIINDNDNWLTPHQRSLNLPARRSARAPEPLQTCAQTNIQLYNQCIELGMEERELGNIRQAYELACTCCGHLYRSSGKSFVAHLVGTASILAHYGAHPRMVIAGMLHSLYKFGDLSYLGHDMTTQRARVQVLVGHKAENLVQRYTEIAWGDGPEALPGPIETLPILDAKVLFIRAANDLEERLDKSLGYSNKPDREFKLWFDTLRKITTLLEQPALGEALEAANRELAAFEAPATLVQSSTRSS